jgi:hypothetical protein
LLAAKHIGTGARGRGRLTAAGERGEALRSSRHSHLCKLPGEARRPIPMRVGIAQRTWWLADGVRKAIFVLVEPVFRLGVAADDRIADPALDNDHNAWQALRMIREAVETLGPPGVLPSEEAVLTLYGREPIHGGQAIVDALTKMSGKPPGA